MTHHHRALKANYQQVLGGQRRIATTTTQCHRSRKGRHDEAEHRFSQVLAARERLLGRSHPASLSTRLRLARVYADQGKLSQAETLRRQVLADRQQLGDDHRSTLTTRSVLARIIGLQGKHALAEHVAHQLLADQ